MDKTEELLTRGVANIIPNKDELRKVLVSVKKLNVYLGIDPTATKIHLGHAAVLRKLNEFAKLGHNVTFLIGDFTALIGDTSDKDTERPVLTPEQIQENFKTYKKQAEKILDFSKIKVRHNSEWLNKLTSRELIKLVQQFSFGDFGSRELIKKRLEEGKRVGMHEGLYPALQGYDSYFLDTDIQLGGTDQTFNMQAGRTLLKRWKNKDSFVLATEFLMGTDGRKMSKSWGNAIWLDDNPQDMFTKVMAIQDNLIDSYFILGTNKDLKTIEEIKSGKSPMDVKKELAKIIVTELHNEKDAMSAKGNFEQTVQGEKLPDDIPVFKWVNSNASGPSIAHALFDTGLVKTISEGKRVTVQGGTAINDTIINNPNSPYIPNEGDILRVGKRKFVKIKIIR
ncbi:MAG: tyrosine--tRNA ligase [Candidatus Levybacteria bacterium]|nr:tyrosine--tRNA ligase [Candidatus Levybacteria bacterium]